MKSALALVVVVAAATACNDPPVIRDVAVANDTRSDDGPYEVRVDVFSPDGVDNGHIVVDDGDRPPLSLFDSSGTEVRAHGAIGGRPVGTRVRFAVIVCDPGGACATAPDDFPTHAWEFVVGAVPSAPTIDSITPQTGPASGATVVDVRGADFREGDLAVFFGDVEAAHVERLRGDLLRVTTPAHEPGVVDVRVQNGDDGATALREAFTFTPVPTLAEIRPQSGPEAGGTRIDITGTGFAPDDRVLVDGVACRSFVFFSSEHLICNTPPGIGTVDVEVVANDGGVGRLVDAFRFIAPPRIDAVAPSSGNADESQVITVVGSGFQGDAVITVGGTPCTNAIITETSLSCTVAPGAPGIVDVVVTNFDGQSGVLAGGYARIGPPVVVVVVPDRGPYAGGNTVHVFGAGLDASDAIFFDGVAGVVVDAIDDIELVVTVPPSVLPLEPAPDSGVALVDVTVQRTRDDDQRSAVLTDGYGYRWPPIITAVAPASGPTAGGTLVVVTGRFFTDTTQIAFDGAACVDLTFVNATTMTCTTPPGEAGLADVSAVDPIEGVIVEGFTLVGGYTYVPPPRVDSIEPPEGPTFGGDPVTVRGDFFLPGALVFIDGAPCSGAVVVDAQTITCTTPPGERGRADVRVVNVDAQGDTAAGIYEYVGVAVTPDHGFPVGFTRVSVRSAGFDPNVRIFFDDVVADCSFVSSREVICQTPAHRGGDTGTVEVRFENPDGTGDSDDAFTYTALSPVRRAIDNGGRDPNHVAIADADGDGDNDVFVANGRVGQSETSSVFINNGGFDFNERTLPGSDVTGNKIDIGSINNDEFPDLVISASSDVGAVLLRSTGPAAWAVVDLPLVPQNSSFDAQLDDVMGDARDDLFILAIGCEFGDPNNPNCDPNADGVDVLFEQTGQNGGSALTRRNNVIPHDRGQTHDHKFVVTDLDGDADKDIVVVVNNTSFPSAENRVLRNRVNEQQGFVKETSGALDSMRGDLYDIDAGDIDGDGDPDVITSICQGDGAVSSEVVLRNDNGNLVVDDNALPTFRADCTVGAKMVDVDSDGDLDLFWGGSFSVFDPRLFVRLYINRGDGTFVDASAHAQAPDAALEGSNLACDDLDGDGDVDCVLAGGAPPISPNDPGRVFVLEQRAGRN